MHAYDGYWGEQPEVTKATYVWRSESAVRAAMVAKGEAGIAPNIAVQDATDESMGSEAAGAEGAGPPGSLGGGGGEMGGSRVERAGGGPPGGAPRPLRRPEGQGVTDGRPSPVALRRAAAERRGALLISPHSAPWAQRKGGPKLVGSTGSSSHMPWTTLNAVDPVILAKSARAAQHPARAALRGSAPEPAPTSAAAAVGQARRDGAPAAAALPARPGASLGSFPRLAGLLSGRSTPKSCTTTLLFRPRSAHRLSSAWWQKCNLIEASFGELSVLRLRGVDGSAGASPLLTNGFEFMSSRSRECRPRWCH